MGDYSTTNAGITSFANNISTRRPVILLRDDISVGKTNDFVFNKVYIPSFIYTIIMLALGSIGNTVVFYIYFTRWRKTTSRVFILALAAFDLINSFITTPTELYFMHNWFQTTNGVLCKFSRFLTFMMNNCSSFTLLGIAVDRYMNICRPLRTQMSTKQAKIIVFVGTFVAILFAWPALVVYGIQTVPVPVAPRTYVVGHLCLIADSFVETDYPLHFVIVLLTGNLLIDVTLIVFYTLIAIQVIKRGSSFLCPAPGTDRKLSHTTSQSLTEDVILDDQSSGKSPSILKKFANKYGGSQEKSENEDEMKGLNSKKRSLRKTNSGGGAADKRAKFNRQRSMSVQSEEVRRARMIKITLMLFLVTLLFMLSFIPYCVIVIIRYVQPDYYISLSYTGKAVYQFILRSYLLSMSLNPVIYSFMSEKFREECRNSFRKILRVVNART